MNFSSLTCKEKDCNFVFEIFNLNLIAYDVLRLHRETWETSNPEIYVKNVYSLQRLFNTDGKKSSMLEMFQQLTLQHKAAT